MFVKEIDVKVPTNSTTPLPSNPLTVLPASANVRASEIVATDAELVGNYGLKIVFSDGHSTGIYSWDYLYELGENQEKYWSQYLEKLAAAGASRE